MSLAQHVTQAEGIDYERPFIVKSDQGHPVGTTNGDDLFVNSNHPGETNACTDAPQWRPLSFTPAEKTRQGNPIAAYEVSPTRRCGKPDT